MSSTPAWDAAISLSNIPTGVLPVGSEIGAVGRIVSTSATISAAIWLISSAFFTTTSVGSCVIPKLASVQIIASSAGDNTARCSGAAPATPSTHRTIRIQVRSFMTISGRIATALEQIDDWIGDSGVPGAAAVVWHRGEIVGRRYAGEALPGVPVDAET